MFSGYKISQKARLNCFGWAFYKVKYFLFDSAFELKIPASCTFDSQKIDLKDLKKLG